MQNSNFFLCGPEMLDGSEEYAEGNIDSALRADTWSPDTMLAAHPVAGGQFYSM